MNRELMNCENLASLAYSSNAIEGKRFHSQISVYVHGLPQPHPPSLAIKEDIGGGRKKKQIREEQCLICKTEIFHFFAHWETIAPLLIWCWHWANSVYSTWKSSRTFLSHPGQARQFWHLLWYLLFFLLLCYLSLFAGGDLRPGRWNRARSPPAQWVLNFFFIALPRWSERSPTLVFQLSGFSCGLAFDSWPCSARNGVLLHSVFL